MSAKWLLLFCLLRLFPVSGRIYGASLRFGLRFCWVNFPCLTPTITAGNLLYGHDKIFLMGYTLIFNAKVTENHFGRKKSDFFSKKSR